jgi:hypothetical protein
MQFYIAIRSNNIYGAHITVLSHVVFLAFHLTVLSRVVFSNMLWYRFASCGTSIMSFYRFLLSGAFWHVILPFCLVWYFLACHFTVLSRVVLSSMSFYRFVSCGTF